MMTLKIDQTVFEKYVPALISPDSLIFERLSSFVDEATEKLDVFAHLSDEDIASNELLNYYQRVVCSLAAYNAIPEIDLVITDNGFGVVSNNNVVPASSERVSALREQLYHQYSDADDILFEKLLNTSWKSSKYAIKKIFSLLWSPMIMRSYGITRPDGSKVYREEFNSLKTELFTSESFVKKIMGNELYNALLSNYIAGISDSNKLYYQCIEITSRLMAAYILHKDKHAIDLLTKEVFFFIQENSDSLSEYKNSTAYQANNYIPYENKKEDTTFFFG